ncbi:hypothetical protein EJ03DRAFT_336625 [Teratosphaeria nubilosa]|uniref:Uncharacterized protein n=1 Tax=Teratosphaeria nubilosa TaxID=161662 RepID=A0A6G1L8P6_9PEZI|nr:hypothetical protein EJ03DRAFT_336625 [Teratosphaeria nubilosa]
MKTTILLFAVAAATNITTRQTLNLCPDGDGLVTPDANGMDFTLYCNLAFTGDETACPGDENCFLACDANPDCCGVNVDASSNGFIVTGQCNRSNSGYAAWLSARVNTIAKRAVDGSKEASAPRFVSSASAEAVTPVSVKGIEGRDDPSDPTCLYTGPEHGNDDVGGIVAQVCMDLVGHVVEKGDFGEETLTFKDGGGTITVGVHYTGPKSYLWQEDDCQAAIKALIADCSADGHGIQSAYEWYYDRYQTCHSDYIATGVTNPTTIQNHSIACSSPLTAPGSCSCSALLPLGVLGVLTKLAILPFLVWRRRGRRTPNEVQGSIRLVSCLSRRL